MPKNTQHTMLALTLGLLAAVLPAAVCAKPMPLTVSGQIGYRSTHELRLMGEVQWALTDVLALRMRGGPAFFDRAPYGTLMAGPVASLDALTWVPSLYLMGGIAAREIRPLVQLGGELKRYVSLHSAWVVGAGAEWAGAKRFGGIVSLGFAHQL